jgi:hypothetical protein
MIDYSYEMKIDLEKRTGMLDNIFKHHSNLFEKKNNTKISICFRHKIYSGRFQYNFMSEHPKV